MSETKVINERVSIHGLDKVQLLNRLFVAAGLVTRPRIYCLEDTLSYLDESDARLLVTKTYIHAFKGRIIACDLSKDWVDPLVFDSQGYSRTFAQIVQTMRIRLGLLSSEIKEEPTQDEKSKRIIPQLDSHSYRENQAFIQSEVLKRKLYDSDLLALASKLKHLTLVSQNYEQVVSRRVKDFLLALDPRSYVKDFFVHYNHAFPSVSESLGCLIKEIESITCTRSDSIRSALDHWTRPFLHEDPILHGPRIRENILTPLHGLLSASDSAALEETQLVAAVVYRSILHFQAVDPRAFVDWEDIRNRLARLLGLEQYQETEFVPILPHVADPERASRRLLITDEHKEQNEHKRTVYLPRPPFDSCDQTVNGNASLISLVFAPSVEAETLSQMERNRGQQRIQRIRSRLHVSKPISD